MWVRTIISDILRYETTMVKSIVICDFYFQDYILFVQLCIFLSKANCLSTLFLQYDKRMDDELRGAKRKIKLVQEQVHVTLNINVLVRFSGF